MWDLLIWGIIYAIQIIMKVFHSFFSFKNNLYLCLQIFCHFHRPVIYCLFVTLIAQTELQTLMCVCARRQESRDWTEALSLATALIGQCRPKFGSHENHTLLHKWRLWLSSLLSLYTNQWRALFITACEKVTVVFYDSALDPLMKNTSNLPFQPIHKLQFNAAYRYGM